ncbi:MAG: hypothetical protein AAFQ63_17000 [Cyanobacteria bacterium J06621_11]
MDSQPLTLQVPNSMYQRLVELATQSKRPVAEETVRILIATLANETADNETKRSTDINARLEQLSLLTDEELWKAATSKTSEEDNDLMQALLEKRQREGLTSQEAEQVQTLSDYFNQIMMVRAKSAVLLSNRGHNVSSLAPLS